MSAIRVEIARRAREWLLSTCASGDVRVDVSIDDEPSDPPCDCVESLTAWALAERDRALAEVEAMLVTAYERALSQSMGRQSDDVVMTSRLLTKVQYLRAELAKGEG